MSKVVRLYYYVMLQKPPQVHNWHFILLGFVMMVPSETDSLWHFLFQFFKNWKRIIHFTINKTIYSLLHFFCYSFKHDENDDPWPLRNFHLGII